MITALTNAALKGGSYQLRSRNSRTPWNKPQSTSTCACPASIRYFEPVTVPAAPQNERDDIALDFSDSKISESTEHVYQGNHTVVWGLHKSEVSTGSGSDRVCAARFQIVWSVETRSLPLPVLTSSKGGRSQTEADLLLTFHRLLLPFSFPSARISDQS